MAMPIDNKKINACNNNIDDTVDHVYDITNNKVHTFNGITLYGSYYISSRCISHKFSITLLHMPKNMSTYVKSIHAH